MSAINDICRYRVIPVVTLDHPADARPVAEALLAGGLPVAEVTFRTPASGKVLAAMAAVPGLTAGAGTVTTAAQADDAKAAGARFVVSPGLSAAVVARCRELELPVVPGTATPSEVMAAVDSGLEFVKFFPAETLGGVATIRALAAVFPAVRFVPTGGITARNLGEYLAEPSVAAVGGTWLVARELLARQDWDQVTRLTAEAVAAAGEG